MYVEYLGCFHKAIRIYERKPFIRKFGYQGTIITICLASIHLELALQETKHVQ